MGLIFDAIVWISGWIAVIFAALCICAALYLATEIAEEASSLIRKILRKSLFVITGLYILIWIDGSPILLALLGITSHLSFIPIFNTFPYVNPISLKTLVPIAFLLMNHFSWMHYFMKELMNDIEFISMKSMLGFFVVFVWAIPTMFFVSLMDEDDALPWAATPSKTTQYSSSMKLNSYEKHDEMQELRNISKRKNSTLDISVDMYADETLSGNRKRRHGLFRKIIDPLIEKKESVLDSYLPRGKKV